MGVNLPEILVVTVGVVFCVLFSKVVVASFTKGTELILFELMLDPVGPHFRCIGLLTYNGVVDNVFGGAVSSFLGSSRLRTISLIKQFLGIDV